MIRIAICDDEPGMRSIIQTEMDCILKRLSKTCSCSMYESGTDLISACMNRNTFDLVLLDIEMPGLDGIQTARLLREAYEDLIIIFLTSHEEHSREGYHTRAHRYVLKRDLLSELSEAVESALVQLENRPRYISFQSDQDGMIQIRVKDILYFETVNRKIIVHMDAGSFQSRDRMNFQEFMQPFEGQGFFPCYRCIMVNLDAVWSLMNDLIILTNRKSIPVSRSQIPVVMKLLSKRTGG